MESVEGDRRRTLDVDATGVVVVVGNSGVVISDDEDRTGLEKKDSRTTASKRDTGGPSVGTSSSLSSSSRYHDRDRESSDEVVAYARHLLGYCCPYRSP